MTDWDNVTQSEQEWLWYRKGVAIKLGVAQLQVQEDVVQSVTV